MSTLETVGFTEITVYDEDANLAEPEYNDYAIIACRK